jgi:hypothetical protein
VFGDVEVAAALLVFDGVSLNASCDFVGGAAVEPPALDKYGARYVFNSPVTSATTTVEARIFWKIVSARRGLPATPFRSWSR